MVLDFNTELELELQQINFLGTNKELIVHDKHEHREHHNSDEIINNYHNHKWQVVDFLNQKYSHILESPIDLHNWLNKNQEDEVAYFLNEVGSNSLNHSEFKTPKSFHIWQGEKGFIVAISQNGAGFNAQHVNENKIKDNQGAAFEFFRNCKSKVFFDNSNNAKVVYLRVLFE